MLDPVTRRIAFGNGAPGRLAVMYHAIDSAKARPKWRWSVSMSGFRQQMDYLEEYGWLTTRIEDLSVVTASPSERRIFITFDDGYADTIAAVEELVTRGMTATWFVVSDAIGQTAPWGRNATERRKLLSATHLREMAEAGMEIGSHTRTHADLSTLKDSELDQEVRGSKELLEDLLGKPVQSFAYPFGRYGRRERDKVRSAGYQSACSCRAGWIRPDDDPLQIRRLAIYNTDGINQFARKVAFGDSEVGWSKVGRYVWTRARARWNRLWQLGRGH